MWIELARAAYPEVRVAPPADIGVIERRLGDPVPPDLRALLLETDGLLDDHTIDAVWSAERIATDNEHFRRYPSFAALYRPFDRLLFFGDDGRGDQFAFDLDDLDAGVFRWEHATDRRRRVADNLADYLRTVLGELTAPR